MKRIFRRILGKKDSAEESAIVVSKAAAPVPLAVESVCPRSQTFVLLALCPSRKAFEIKEFTLKHQSVQAFLAQLPSILKPHLADQKYTRLIDGQGHVVTGMLSANALQNKLLVAAPGSVSTFQCNALARDILADRKVTKMLLEKGYHIAEWTQTPEVFNDEPDAMDTTMTNTNEGNDEDTQQSCWSLLCCCRWGRKRNDKPINNTIIDPSTYSCEFCLHA